ncbi:universal stress protein [Sphingosinicella rhizophila]|uniref:Universal stress protein n=1 Tax=Sphingosinicella rhizophila TaxID=3050082 RepID=A0ABU3QCB1_9SPHN|nr:universal stress protein [Sphingosinicella sp. GR2756]MDT9601041.1 universal stress protein [Sphingosinicella sp. GR2756]
MAVQAPSGSYDRTLLALDFDEASKAAGRAALAMGIFEPTEVVVMHAFDAPAEGMLRMAMETTDAVDDYVAGERTEAAAKLHGLVRELGLPPSEHRIAAMNGTPARSILESARKEDAHLIVLGTNQRKGFERLLIGSVTEDVIRDAHRDVLIIPTEG